MANKNQKTVAINTVNKKEEKNMKKITGAFVKFTKKGHGTVTISQPVSGGSVYYTVFGVTAELPKDQINTLVSGYKTAGWKMEVKQHEEPIAASPKETVSFKGLYQEQLAKINSETKLPEDKANSPIEPKEVPQKKAPQTRAEALTEKYGSLDTRRAYAQKRSAIWNEEATKITEEVKKTGKRLRKDAWKKLMNERVTSRLKAEGCC